MAFHHDVSRCLASFIARMRGRAGDDVCLALIEHYLEQRDGNDGTRWAAGSGGGAEDARIKAAVATMPPLTRAILVLVVRNRMSVAEVSRRFGMNEDRVCRHYRLAVAIVLKHRKGESFERGAGPLCRDIVGRRKTRCALIRAGDARSIMSG